MGVINNIKNKIRETKEKMKEKARFRKLVEQETLPIRRKAYLEKKKRMAIEEGKKLAEQSSIINKSQEVKKEDFFSTKPSGDLGFDFETEFEKTEKKKRNSYKKNYRRKK